MVTPDHVTSTPVKINDHTLVKVSGNIKSTIWRCEECGQERTDTLYYQDFTCGDDEDDDS